MTVRRSTIVAATLAGFLTTGAVAHATDGNVYTYGPGAWNPGAQTTVTRPSSTVWQITIPELASVVAGDKWNMAWGCPAGSEAAFIGWNSLRYAGASALYEGVFAEGQAVRVIPDVEIPQSPSGGAQYTVAIPPGRCTVNLKLVQTQTVRQHARTYWVAGPYAQFRDLTPPSVTQLQHSTGWLNGSMSTASVGWTASDNFGSDGMLQHQVRIGGATAWTGSPGAGDHQVSVPLGSVPDGIHELAVLVAGDGTGNGGAGGVIHVDRTPPESTVPRQAAGGGASDATFSWSPLDRTSGVSTSSLEINASSDGSGAGGWTTAATLPGDGSKQTLVSLAGLSDGVHATRVRVVDNAGNASFSTQGEVIVDRTAPTVSIETPPAGPLRRLNLGITLNDNLASRWGLGETRVEINDATDASTTGSWVPVAAPSVYPAGAHRLPLDLSSAFDGRHLLRVSTANGGPNGAQLVGTATVMVDVDNTPPTVTEVQFTASGADEITARWLARDSRAGVASARIDWLDGSVWKALSGAAAAGGAGSLVAATRLVPNGVHQFRLVVADGAGNESIVSGPRDGMLVDNAPPEVTGLRVSGPPWVIAWHVTSDDIGRCPTRVSISGGGTGGEWREIALTPSRPGDNSVSIPTSDLTAGSYRVRVVVCDAAGNTTTSELAGVALTAVGAASDTRFAGAKLTISVPGHRATRTRRGLRISASLRYGTRIRVTGTLTSKGRPVTKASILVIGYGGARIGRTVTSSSGRFALFVRPSQSGPLTFAVEAGSGPVAVAANVGVRVRVAPAISLALSSRRAAAGGAPIVFSGTVLPSPSQLHLTDDKAVVLEWRDPSRQVWRPIANDVLAVDGTFRFEWQFQAKGQAIPVRVRVPKELGWHLEEGVSATRIIRVR